MKKEFYLTPDIQVVEINIKNALMLGSLDNDGTTPGQADPGEVPPGFEPGGESRRGGWLDDED